MKKKYLSVIICLLLVFNCIFTCICPVSVLALSGAGLQSTIASIILSLFLQAGAAPVNQSFIDTINTSYGVTSNIGTIQDAITNGLLTESGGTLVDTGLSAAIENAPAYDILDLGSVFETYVDDGLAVASGGTNIANSAINVGTVGTIGAFAGAASIGVGAGVLLNHVREYISNFVKYGLPMSAETRREIAENIPDGYSRCYYYSNVDYSGNIRSNYYFVENGIIGGNIKNKSTDLGQEYYIYGRCKNYYNENQKYNHLSFINSSQYGDPTIRTINGNNSSSLGSLYNAGGKIRLIESNYPDYESDQVFDDYVNNVKDGLIEIPDSYSPDIINQNGNINEVDSMSPTVSDGYDLRPVNIDDYQEYADNANNNTDDGNINKPVQGEEFDNLIDSLIVESSIIPDQGVTDPDVPDRPIIPDQPTVPGKDPITGEQQSEVLQGITTPDLRSVFPFCIPFDLYNILGVLKYEGREAPVIVWEANFLGKTYPVIIDLSPYEEAASILRLMELILFIIGLAVATRKLIGAGG